MSVFKARSLRQTVVATLLVGFGLLTAVQYLATAYFVSRKVHGIEAIDAFDKIDRVQHAIDLARNDLARTTEDWAVWDETYRFVLGERGTFIEDNLNVQTFSRLRLNFVALIRDDGTVLFAQVLHPGKAELQAAPDKLVRLVSSSGAERPWFAASDFGPLLIVSRPIEDLDTEEIGHAKLVMGRSLALHMEALSRVTAVPVAVAPSIVVEGLMSGDRSRSMLSEERKLLFFANESIDAFAPLDGLEGEPVAWLHAKLQRPLETGLDRALLFLLAITLLIGLVFGVAALVVLRRRVVRPIEKLVAAAESIGTADESSQRLAEDHHEREFVMLSRSLNTMLAQVEAQQSLRADRDAAVEANRLKSEFLATMSHEIRTPMNGVLGMCELLQRTELDPRQRHLADTLLRSARSLLGILNDILDFSKIESGKLSLETAAFAPSDLLQSACAPFASAAQSKGLNFSIHIDDAVPTLLIGDPLRVRQVLNNLLSNAVKFTNHGAIAVSCSVDRCDAQSAMLRIVVKDSGIGVEPSARARIFDAFAQAESSTTRRFGGTGLGLAIVRRIVNLMGGEVGVQSELDRGSTFWFTLRLQRTSAPESLMLSSAIDATGPRFATTSAPKVLLAEDNAINREVLREMLEVIGCDVTVVENGAQAIAVAAGVSFDVILMDCQMPVMDGHAATAKLRVLERASGRRSAFIAALTADATMENRQHCFDVGMNVVLTKPVSQPRLRELMLDAMRRPTIQNALA